MSEGRTPVSRQQRRAQERARRKRIQGALTLGAAALAAVPAAQAATFNVSNLSDSGAGSLRQAIADANAAAGADVIAFDADVVGTITLTTGQLDITDSVDIQGPGAASLAVSGNNASRVFYLYNGSVTLDVTISGLTITGGNDSIGGGVVDFDENLTLDAVTITGNTASGDGGGLWADGFNMNLTIRDSTISGNDAGSDGGGIYVEDTGGPLLIQSTVISGNDAADDGGGIYFYDPDDSTTIVDSTISGNTAGDLGGGIYFYDTDGGTHTIDHSTVSGNSAAVGGGLFLYGPDNPFAIESSTISGNQATAGDGGGIFLYSFYASFDLRHMTIASNSATGAGGGMFTQAGPVVVGNSIVGDDLATAIDGSFDLTYTLVETPGTANITDNGGNILSQDPQLGALANNGGPTLTHLPASTSPVLNAGDPAFVPPPSTDQRGFARVVNGRLDMGAVELAPGTIQLTVNAANVAENAGTVTITATRTGGADGAVSVVLDTADGTAAAPGDYTAVVAGLLNWANQDSASKSINITIVNDITDEPDETFTATISTPTGGAVLGAPVTATITIQDDDLPLPPPVEVPTIGDVGRVLLTGLFAMAGLYLLRRRKGLAAPVLILTLLTAGGAAPTHAAARDVKAVTLSQVTTRAQVVTLQLSDGSSLQVPVGDVEVMDRRAPRSRKSGAAPGLQSLATGQPLVVKVRRNPDGSVKKVKLQVFETLQRAQASLQEDKK